MDENGRPLWAGAATFDTSVGFSRTTGQITHHIEADVDVERDKLLADLNHAGVVAQVDWIGYHTELQGHNGGGDPWHTDGRVPVAVIAVVDTLTAGANVAVDQDEQFRSMVLGTWEDEYQGKRTMMLKEDGTGTMEWPPKSGKQQEFPEIDRSDWFDLAMARKKIKAGQEALIEELATILDRQ